MLVALQVLPVPGHERFRLVFLAELHHQRLALQHPYLGRRQVIAFPGRQLHVPLDHDEFVQGMGQRRGDVLEAAKHREIEWCQRGLAVAGEGVGNVLDCVQPAGLEAGQYLRRHLAKRREVVLPGPGRCGKLVPGGVGILQGHLAVETRPPRVPAALPGFLIVVRAHVVEQSLAKQLAIGQTIIPFKPQGVGDRLQRLAQHRVVLLLSNLGFEQRGDWRIVGGKLGHEIVNGRSPEYRLQMPATGVEQEPLGELVEEHEVDRGVWLAVGIGRRDLDHGLQDVRNPVLQQPGLDVVGLGRPLGHSHDRAPLSGQRRSVFVPDHQRAEQVKPVLQVVVLHIDMHQHQVGVLLRIVDRQRAVPLVRHVGDMVHATIDETGLVAFGPVNQFVETRSDRPGGGQVAGENVLARRRHERDGFLLGAVNHFGATPLNVLEARQIVSGGDASRQQHRLLTVLQVGDQRKVVGAGGFLQAKRVVEAAVALVGEVKRYLVELRPQQPGGNRAVAQHQVVDGGKVGGGVVDQFEIARFGPEHVPGDLQLCRQRFAVVLSGGAPPIEDAKVDRMMANPGVLEDGLQHVVIEGHLQAMLDLGGGGTLHVGDERVKRPVGSPFEAQQVDIAPQVPGPERSLQPWLQQHHHLPRKQGGRSLNNGRIVAGRLLGGANLGRKLDHGIALLDVGGHGLLELGARPGQDRWNRLGSDIDGAQESGARSALLEPQPQIALALVQSDELRHIGGRDGDRGSAGVRWNQAGRNHRSMLLNVHEWVRRHCMTKPHGRPLVSRSPVGALHVFSVPNCDQGLPRVPARSGGSLSVTLAASTATCASTDSCNGCNAASSAVGASTGSG